MSDTTPARRAALLRLLEDWEAKRMTNEFSLDPLLVMKLHTDWLILGPTKKGFNGQKGFTLTQDGVNAARAIRDTQEASDG